MTTQRQIEANRHNALSSTGPRTVEGKERSRMNALTHGLQARNHVLPDEDEGAFERLREGMWLDLLPEGELEEQLAERASLLFWRLARAGRLETGLYAWRHHHRTKQRIRGDQFDRMYRAENLNGEKHERFAADDEMERSAAAGAALDAAVLAPGFLEDARTVNIFEKLTRYEASLQRALESTLDQLLKLQRRRETGAPGSVVTLEGEARRAV